MLLYQILACAIHGEIMKKLYKSSKFKISASTRNETFKLSDGFYSVSDIQDYFEYILKEYGETTDIPSWRIYINKMKNRITRKSERDYCLELLTAETMKLLGNA